MVISPVPIENLELRYMEVGVPSILDPWPMSGVSHNGEGHVEAFGTSPTQANTIIKNIIAS